MASAGRHDRSGSPPIALSRSRRAPEAASETGWGGDSHGAPPEGGDPPALVARISGPAPGWLSGLRGFVTATAVGQVCGRWDRRHRRLFRVDYRRGRRLAPCQAVVLPRPRAVPGDGRDARAPTRIADGAHDSSDTSGCTQRRQISYGLPGYSHACSPCGLSHHTPSHDTPKSGPKGLAGAPTSCHCSWPPALGQPMLMVFVT